MYSQDEIIVLMFSALCAAIGWGKFARQACLIWPYRYPVVARFPLFIALAMAATLLYYILAQWSSHDVRDSVPYTVFYLVMGAGWLALCRHLLDYLDLRVRDDVLERGNVSSAWACGGAFLGLMACFAGSNVGDGPGWWVVVYSAVMAAAGASLAWVILEMSMQMADTISIERDVAAGMRAGGFWIGAGLILGRAAAGNWVSFDAANRDFLRYSWPVLGLLSVAILIELVVRPGGILSKTPIAFRGALPAAGYIAAGIGCLIAFGQP